MADNKRNDPTEPSAPLPKGYFRDPGCGPLKNQGDRLEKTNDTSTVNSDSDMAQYSGD